jgi:hypothetical protein
MTWSLFWPVWLTRMVVIKLWLPAVCLGGSVTWHDPAWTHRRTQSLVVCSCRCRSPANCGCGGGRIQQRYVWFILMLSCMVHVCIAHAHAWCQRFWRAEESRYRVAFSIGRGNKKGEKTEQACSVVFFLRMRQNRQRPVKELVSFRATTYHQHRIKIQSAPGQNIICTGYNSDQNTVRNRSKYRPQIVWIQYMVDH